MKRIEKILNAIDSQNIEIKRVNNLLRNRLFSKIDINAIGTKGETFLMCASRWGHKEVVEILINKDADVNATGEDGRTALHKATGIEIAKLLVEKGADVNAKDQGEETPLHNAYAFEDLEIVELLIQKGADINAKNKDGVTALMYAGEEGYEEIIEMFIEKGADLNAKDKNGKTALIRAVEYGGFLENIETLIEKGADVNAKDKDGNTALHYAVEGEDKAIIELLKSIGIQGKRKVKANDETKFKIVKIGTQTWMAENLNVSHFRNGDPIPEAKTAKEWLNAGEKGKPAWCYYDNKSDNDKIYGKLYNWYALKDIRGLSPKRWHIPSDKEWTTLANNLGGFDLAGGRLKEIGTNHWKNNNIGVNDETKFLALPGGQRLYSGAFYNIGNEGYWWSSTEEHKNAAYFFYMSNINARLWSGRGNKKSGFSIRCIKD